MTLDDLINRFHSLHDSTMTSIAYIDCFLAIGVEAYDINDNRYEIILNFSSVSNFNKDKIIANILTYLHNQDVISILRFHYKKECNKFNINWHLDTYNYATKVKGYLELHFDADDGKRSITSVLS